MKTILLKNVPEGIHRAFKAYCSSRGLSMKAELMQHISGCSGTVVLPVKDGEDVPVFEVPTGKKNDGQE